MNEPFIEASRSPWLCAKLINVQYFYSDGTWISVTKEVLSTDLEYYKLFLDDDLEQTLIDIVRLSADP